MHDHGPLAYSTLLPLIDEVDLLKLYSQTFSGSEPELLRNSCVTQNSPLGARFGELH